MRAGTIAFWGLTAAIAVAPVPAPAVQDGVPLVRPNKQTPAKPAGATLLLLCDLACNWKLDGESTGHIDAGASAKVKVEIGEHLVVASTIDGADQIKQRIDVKSTGQTLYEIALQPVHDARLKAEKEAREAAAQEARDKAAREQEAKDKIAQEARDKAAQEELQKKAREQAPRDQAARMVWTDPATGLMWAQKDSRSNVTWQQAADYCKNLQLDGHSNWRLASIDELNNVYDSGNGSSSRQVTNHVKGNLQVSGWEWSGSMGNASGEAWGVNFVNGMRSTDLLGSSGFNRALCVRRPGE
jgi:hypothetical protein